MAFSWRVILPKIKKLGKDTNSNQDGEIANIVIQEEKLN